MEKCPNFRRVKDEPQRRVIEWCMIKPLADRHCRGYRENCMFPQGTVFTADRKEKNERERYYKVSSRRILWKSL